MERASIATQRGGDRVDEDRMHHGHRQRDVTPALLAHAAVAAQHAALVADLSCVLGVAQLAARAQVIFDRAEDHGAAQAAALRLRRARVDLLQRPDPPPPPPLPYPPPPTPLIV